MRNQTVRYVIRFLAPRILAVALPVFWAVDLAAAAEAQLNKISETQLEITGGSGKEAWRLRYGIPLQAGFKPHFVASEGNRAWYSYGGWLRSIDTQKGVVIGRWHYPGEIINLTPEGMKVQVEIEDRMNMEQVFHRKLELDPADPHVPYWPTNFLMIYHAHTAEGQMLWPSVINVGAPGKISAEEAKKILPELEDAVRRDPFTPWFRVGLGRVLRDLGDPRATEEFQAAINTSSTDFTEIFPISVYFDAIGENDLARTAFERGCQDFWQKGNDPRMFTALIARFMVYSPKGNDWGDPATPHGRELIERMYKVMPYGEGAKLAWHLYAEYLTTHGSTDQARLWRGRAEDSAQNSASFFGLSVKGADRSLLLAFSSFWAAIIYAFVLFARYRPQRRLDLAARKGNAGMPRGFAFLNTEYWSRRQRVAFFTIVLLGWFSVGLTGQYVESILRGAAMPVGAGAGNFGGPVTIAGLERLPSTAQRDLMVAVAYQQDGQADKAESLYRGLPHFAESWNNLGVILKEAGKDQEAKAAFEKALELDPMMAEAALNLGRPPSDFWTEQHQKYLPGRAMLAPPRATHITGALVGGSSAMVFLRALAGPFSTGRGSFDSIGRLAG